MNIDLNKGEVGFLLKVLNSINIQGIESCMMVIELVKKLNRRDGSEFNFPKGDIKEKAEEDKESG